MIKGIDVEQFRSRVVKGSEKNLLMFRIFTVIISCDFLIGFVFLSE